MKQRVNVVLRDVKGAFDRVWYEGLKYRIPYLDLPPNLTKTLCNFITNRKAKIEWKGTCGEEFELSAGVPQGAIWSPTLYNIYIAPLPQPLRHHIHDIIYADDITQIITSPFIKETTYQRTNEREIERINTFEAQWKIKINMAKFTIIPIVQRNSPAIRLNNQNQPHGSIGTILGKQISPTGYKCHPIERAKKEKHPYKNSKD